MKQATCAACGLTISISVMGEPDYRAVELGFIERCRNFKMKVEKKFEPNRPLSQQMAECPELKAAIAKATQQQ